MRFIAHRGNINGPLPAEENNLNYMMRAIEYGFDVEVDVLSYDKGSHAFDVRHDESQPEQMITLEWFLTYYESLWVHVKCPHTLDMLLNRDMFKSLNMFAHNSDTHVLTSRRFIWGFPPVNRVNRKLERTVEMHTDPIAMQITGWNKLAYGVCADNVFYLREVYHNLGLDVD